MSEHCSEPVRDWVNGRYLDDLFITSVNEAEIRSGIAIMPEGRKRSRLADLVQAMFDHDFRGRILPFDTTAARCFAEIVASRRRAGREIRGFDVQIAAIARAVEMMVATRDIGDFEGCGVELINPWEA
ncbi:MAG: type II toxin-antitoxin system VapC family toxin [Bauldia sp.]|nr:type II toxin-antitoxin system VapC family toxin [Bauldia sp.]